MPKHDNLDRLMDQYRSAICAVLDVDEIARLASAVEEAADAIESLDASYDSRLFALHSMAERVFQTEEIKQAGL